MAGSGPVLCGFYTPRMPERAHNVAMTKHSRNVTLIGFAAAILLAGGVLAFKWADRTGDTFDCGDGLRRRTDIGDFVTKYSGYAVQFEGEIHDQGKIAASLGDTHLRAINEAVEMRREMLKFVIAGYNACAVSRQKFATLIPLFQTMDGLEKRISALAVAGSNGPALNAVIQEYVAVSAELRK